MNQGKKKKTHFGRKFDDVLTCYLHLHFEQKMYIVYI